MLLKKNVGPNFLNAFLQVSQEFQVIQKIWTFYFSK